MHNCTTTENISNLSIKSIIQCKFGFHITCSEFYKHGMRKIKTKPTETGKKVRKSIKIDNNPIF